MTRIISLALASVLALTALAAAPPEVHAEPARKLKATDSVIQTWSATWMGRSGKKFTRDEALQVAKDHNVVVAMRNVLKDHADAMRAANPNLVLLVYVNATFQGNGLNSAWYARNKNGNKVYAKDWPNTYFMNMNTPAYRSYIAERCTEQITASGYDGCFLDVLGSGPLWGDYMSSMPINSATGKAWTHNQWIAQAVKIVDQTKAKNPGRPIAGNGLGQGKRYFSSDMGAAPLSNVLDGAEPELFVRHAHASVNSYKNEADWKSDVDMIIDSQRRGSPAMTMTKVWTSATDAQRNQLRSFALGSFLLGTDGRSYFSFIDRKAAGASTSSHALYDVKLGNPSGSYYKKQGAYWREFQKGLVLVNPTDRKVTVSVGGRYVDPAGKVVTGDLTLQPHTGHLLRTSGVTGTQPPSGGSTPPASATEPETTFTHPQVGQEIPNNPMWVVGRASDDHGVTAVHVAIKNRNGTKWWNAEKSSWGPFVWNDARVDNPGSTDTRWSLQFDPPQEEGSYWVEARAVDAQADLELSRAQLDFTISS